MTPWLAVLGGIGQVQPAHGAGNKNDWQLHIEGALGEMALAKHLGVHWDGKGKMRAPDVGAIDVRTRSKHSYDLIVHDRDDDARYIYLLTGGNGQYRVHGGIHARDAKQERYWKDPAGGRPAYFVPQADLRNPSTELAQIMEIQA